MRNKAGDWNFIRKRSFTAIASVSLFLIFVLLRYRWDKIVPDDSVFPHVDERYGGSPIISPVVDYEECASEQSVLQFAARNQMIRRAVSVKVFERLDGNPARRGLVATEEIAENQVHV